MKIAGYEIFTELDALALKQQLLIGLYLVNMIEESLQEISS